MGDLILLCLVHLGKCFALILEDRIPSYGAAASVSSAKISINDFHTKVGWSSCRYYFPLGVLVSADQSLASRSLTVVLP
jgi:hypothetical protein